MDSNRRDFLKKSLAGSASLALYRLFNPSPASGGDSSVRVDLHKPVGEVPTVCSYCAVGCGMVAAVEKGSGNIVNIEGDPEHPINQGALCAKGAAMQQVRTVQGKPNPMRIVRPLVRRPGATTWSEITWDKALDRISAHIKKSRDENWQASESVKGREVPVNRTNAVASLGGGELDTEACYLLVKMCRALGLVNVEHCARI